MQKSKLLLVSALGALASNALSKGFGRTLTVNTKSEPYKQTKADFDAMAKAEAKRARKNARRVREAGRG